MSKDKNKKSVLKNSAIVVTGQFGSIFLKFFSNIILAWFLTPDAFGIAAIVITVFIGLTLLSDVGIGDSIIRNPHGEEPRFLQAAYVLQIGRGIILFTAIVLIATPVADFYHEPILRDCLIVGGTSLLLDGLYSTKTYVLQRLNQVTPLVVLELVTQVITSLLVIAICVFIAPTVWALVLAHVFNAISRLVGSHYIAPLPRAGFSLKNPYYREILGFGKWIFLGTLFHYVITQSDKLTYGKLANATDLGIYSISSALTNITLLLSFSLGMKVLYPMLSETARDARDLYGEKLREVLNKVLPLLLAFCILTFAFSPLFFSLLYKEDYNPAGTTTQYLALMTWFMVLYDLYQKVPVAYGVPRYTAFASFVTSVFRVGLSLIAFQYFGVLGFIFGLAIGSIVGIIIIQIWMQQNDIKAGFKDIPFSLAFIGLALIYYGLKNWLQINTFDLYFAFTISVIVLSFLYFSYQDAINQFLAKRRGNAPAIESL